MFNKTIKYASMVYLTCLMKKSLESSFQTAQIDTQSAICNVYLIDKMESADVGHLGGEQLTSNVLQLAPWLLLFLFYQVMLGKRIIIYHFKQIFLTQHKP